MQAIVSQQLIPDVNGKQIPAFEIMVMTPAIRNMIRENKVHQIDGVIYSSQNPQLMSIDSCLLRYYKEGKIETAMEHEPEYLRVSQAERERKERMEHV